VRRMAAALEPPGCRDHGRCITLTGAANADATCVRCASRVYAATSCARACLSLQRCWYAWPRACASTMCLLLCDAVCAAEPVRSCRATACELCGRPWYAAPHSEPAHERASHAQAPSVLHELDVRTRRLVSEVRLLCAHDAADLPVHKLSLPALLEVRSPCRACGPRALLHCFAGAQALDQISPGRRREAAQELNETRHALLRRCRSADEHNVAMGCSEAAQLFAAACAEACGRVLESRAAAGHQLGAMHRPE
jgi:hypothetical protein